MIELVIKGLLLLSLLLSTLLMGSVIFSGSDLNPIKMLLLMPGLVWACWLAGLEIKKVGKREL